MTDTAHAAEEIRGLARQVAEEQLRPHAERWDAERTIDDDALRQLAELGFFGLAVPEAYGGMEFDARTMVAAIEELAWGEASVALLLAQHAAAADRLLNGAGEETRRRWLEGVASGETRASLALLDGGADVRAEARGDGWTLTGENHWVIHGRRPGLLLAAARVGDDEMAVFAVPADAEGYRVESRESTMGLRPLEIVRARFDGVRVEHDARLSAEAAAWTGATPLERLLVGAAAVGIAQAALDHAIAYAAQREQFGTKLRDFEGLQIKLADMAGRVQAARALVADAAARPDALRSALAKITASEAAMWVTTQAVQIFGGYGYMRDYPVEKLMRDAKGLEIIGGRNDDLRLLAAGLLYE